MARKQRTLEEVITVAEYAKLDLKEFEKTVQPLWLSEDLNKDNVMLIELDSLLYEHIQQGKPLTLRGEKEDSAVICTESRSYDVKAADTSNSILLLPELSEPKTCWTETYCLEPKEITGIYKTYLEVRDTQPHLAKLRKLLEEKLYKGRELEETGPAGKYSFDDLLNTVQASPSELQKGLKFVHACLIDGYWRILDFDYLYRVVSLILKFISENSWPYNEVHYEKTMETLEELEPRTILHQVLERFGELQPNTSAEDGNQIYILKEDKICQLIAQVLLQAAGKFHLNDFLEAWKLSVPEGFTPDLSHLKGNALIDTSEPKAIWHFPREELPDTLSERFHALFEAKPKWSYEEISPYLEDLVTPKMNIASMLTKYTRSTVISGMRYYNRK